MALAIILFLSVCITVLVLTLVFLYRNQIKLKNQIQDLEVRVQEEFDRAEDMQNEHGLLMTLFNALPVLIYFKDTHSRFVFCNQAISRLMGEADPKVMIGKSDYDYYSEEMAQQYFNHEQTILRTGEPLINHVEPVQPKNGALRWYSSTKLPVRNEKGEIIGVAGTGRDITDQRKTEEALRDSERRLRQIIDLVPHFIFAKDREGRFILANKATADAFGTSVEQLIGHKDIDFLLIDESLQFEEGDHHVIEKGGPHFIPEETMTDAQGNKRYLQTTKIPFHLAGSTESAILGISIDISERKKTDEALQESQELLETAQKVAKMGSWKLDLNQDIIQWSKQVYEIFDVDDFDGKRSTYLSFVHPEDQDLLQETVARCIQDREVYDFDHRIVLPKGEVRWVSEHAVIIQDEQKGIYQMVGTVQDITARKQIEEALSKSEAHYQSLVENLPQNLFCKDLEGRFTFANQRFCITLGQPLINIIDKTDHDFFPNELADKYREDDMQVMQTGCIRDEVEEHRLPTGDRIFVQVMKSPIRNSKNEIIGVQGMFWDVTERKQAEEALQKSKEVAESANRAKSAFLANMSHEIRTPMNGIIGMTELALDTSLTKEQHDYLTMAKQSADSLLCLLNDILDFSKIEAGKLEFLSSPFNLRDSLEDTVKTLAARADQKKLELLCHIYKDVPDSLVGDPGRLRQIVVNLVGNAIKFTEKGEVVVRVRKETQNDQKVCLRFSVTDTGIGIPAEKQKTIFHAFEQVDSSSSRRYGGTGLGLAISSQLVDLMGGNIWVESEFGEGSTFHFTACFDIQEHSENPLTQVPVDVRGMRVLIVDDNATNRQILLEMLSNWSMTPLAVSNGFDALTALREAKSKIREFTLVILDVNMPDMDGFTLAEKIKDDQDLADAIIMMLTSAGQRGDAARCKNLKVSAYLTKPVKQSDLFDAIMTVLDSAPKTALKEFSPITRHSLRENRKRYRILLVEDNKINQKLAIRLLEKRGYTVEIANNGQEAVSCIRCSLFDLILMDVQMPVMDGLEATLRIREIEKDLRRHTPIIAMTAHAMKGDREQCINAGMDEYVSKPLHADLLFEIMDRLLYQQEILRTAVNPEPEDQVYDMNSTEPLNRKLLMEHVDGDHELLQELVTMFDTESVRLLNQAKDLLTQEDCENLARQAHTIKGVLSNFSALISYDLSRRLETAAKESNLKEAKRIYLQLESETEKLKQELHAIIDENKRPAS